jgi:O-antigen/teichoic acid export membrane protein/glycosyltransferase involved in cell wall biosynthesis/O-antigen ligase
MSMADKLIHRDLSEHPTVSVVTVPDRPTQEVLPPAPPAPLPVLIMEWLLYLIIGVLPLDVYFTLPAQSSGVFLSEVLGLEALLFVGAYSAWLRFRNRSSAMQLTWRDALPLVLLLGAGMASALASHYRMAALREALKIVVYLGIFMLAAAVRTRPAVRRNALIALLCGLGVVALDALIIATGKVPDFIGFLLNVQHSSAALPYSTIIRFEATFRYPNELAAYVLILMPILLAYVLTTSDRVVRLLLILGLAATWWMLIFTYTRGALIAACIVAVFIIGFVRGWYWAAAAVIAISSAVMVIVLRGGALASRLVSIAVGTDAAYQTRNVVRDWAWNTFTHHPILGIGAGTLKLLPNAPYLVSALGIRATDAENMYLNILAELGIIGFVAFAIVLVAACLRIWKGIWKKPKREAIWDYGALGVLATLMIYGLADPILVSGQVVGLFCVVIGLAGVPDMQVVPIATPSASSEDVPTEAISRQPTRHIPVVTQRIVFLVNSKDFGGANQHSLNIAQGMQAQGLDVLLVAPPHSPTLERASAVGLPTRALELGMNVGRIKGIVGSLAFLNPLSRQRSRQRLHALADEAPTVFMCPFPREQILATRVPEARCIWVVHSPFRYPAHRLLLQRTWLRAARKAQAVVAVSQRLGMALRQQGIAANRLHVIPNSVPIPTIQATDVENRIPLQIGIAARLVKSKGVQYVIAALPTILARHPQAQLVIAGNGPYESTLRHEVERLGLRAHVEFVGYLADLRSFLTSLHVLVHPTVDPEEVLPTIILEAASFGIPVVASNLTSIPSEVQDGVTGFLTPPGDMLAIAASVNTLLADAATARMMGNAGRALVMKEFSLARAVEQFQALCGEASDIDVSPGNVSLITTVPKAVIRRNALAGRSALVFISKLLTAIATATWTVLAARTLLPTTYGNLALASGLVDLVTFLSDIGIDALAVRELSTLSPADARRYLGTLIYLKVGLGLLGVGIVIGITAVLPFQAGVLPIMFILGPSLFFAALNSLTLILRARSEYISLLLISLTVACIGIGSALSVTFLNGDAIAFASVATLTQMCGGLMALLSCIVLFGPNLHLRLADVRALFVKAVPLGIAFGINILYYRIDVPLVALLASSTQVAKYASTYRILDVLTLLPASLQAATLPQMATLFKRNVGELREFAQQYLEIALVLGSGIGLILSFAATPVLHLLYAGRYDSATPILRVLAWVGATTLVTNVFLSLILTLNKARGLLIACIVGLTVNLTMNSLLIPELGALAAAYATLATEVIVIVTMGVSVVSTLHWRIRLPRVGAIVALTALFALGSQLTFVQALAWPIGTALIFLCWLVGIVPFLRIPGRGMRMSTS